MKPNQKIRISDLFCGIGGIRLGVEQAAEEYGLSVESVFLRHKQVCEPSI
jgi:site-specific DNA-cytosine methylase